MSKQTPISVDIALVRDGEATVIGTINVDGTRPVGLAMGEALRECAREFEAVEVGRDWTVGPDAMRWRSAGTEA